MTATLHKELKHYEGLSWREAQEALKERSILLLMAKDDNCVDVARAYKMHGIEAGTATLCAVLYLNRNGGAHTAMEGVHLYERILKTMEKDGKPRPWLRSHVENMRWAVPWGMHGATRGWPVKPPNWRNIDKLGGLANIMLYLGALELEEGGGTSELVASRTVAKFLKEGVEKKNERRRDGAIPRKEGNGLG